MTKPKNPAGKALVKLARKAGIMAKPKHPLAPTPAQIRQAREKAGLTLGEAAALVHYHGETWRNWERPDGSQARQMPVAAWELFHIKVERMKEAEATPRPVFSRAG